MQAADGIIPKYPVPIPWKRENKLSAAVAHTNFVEAQKPHFSSSHTYAVYQLLVMK
jgi:hypothetical protein